VHKYLHVLLIINVLTKLQYGEYRLYFNRETDHYDENLFTTTYAISAYPNNVVSLHLTHGEVYSIQHYVIKFVSDLRQVGGFLGVLRFPQPIKLTATI
jgi:hypothetical protein